MGQSAANPLYVSPAAQPGAALRGAQPLYLHPGQLVVAEEPTLVRTVLGSCVAICLWDSRLGVGGMNHFLLPSPAGVGPSSTRYAGPAITRLLEGLAKLGSYSRNLQARIVGGASVVGPQASTRARVGTKNVQAARERLEEAGIPVVEEHVGGHRGRKLSFCTRDGNVSVRRL